MTMTTLTAVGRPSPPRLPARTNRLPLTNTLVSSSPVEMSRIIWRMKFLFLIVGLFYNERELMMVNTI
jgi:hypothetical protein